MSDGLNEYPHVIARSAATKQSYDSQTDCFALLAMTVSEV
jgi:hypothetical protein